MRRLASVFGAATLALGVVGGGCSSSTTTITPDGGTPTEGGGGGDAGGGDSTSEGGSGVTADKACTDFAQGYCTQINGCAPFYVTLIYGDLMTCEVRLKIACTPILASNGTSWTAGTIDACSQSLAGVSCSDLLTGNSPAACKAPPGQLADGSPCLDGSQCVNGACLRPATSTCGMCGSKGMAGAHCVANEDCAAGFACTGMGAGATCAPYGAVNAVCDAAHPCDPTLACKTGHCATPDALGQACGSQPSTCNSALGQLCIPSDGGAMCEAIMMAGAGQPCGFLNGSLTACSASGNCNTNGGATGTCQATLADGAACTAGSGPQCLPPARCQGGTCSLPDPTTCH